MLDFSSTLTRDRIIVALDCGLDKALDIARALQGQAAWMKVGMTLYYAHGPHVVSTLKEMGYQVFLDLKFHDIPHQVKGAAASATRVGADMLTLHAIGGEDMMRAAVEGAHEAAAASHIPSPVLLGITVLTSMSEEALKAGGVNRSLEDHVLALAKLAQESGLDGVVSSPNEAAQLRTLLGQQAFLVTPGVRPAGADLGDQHRVATPANAFAVGASHIVVGRPITGAADPAAAFDAIVQSVS